MKNIAIYAGTFDPITFGHIDLVNRATSIFDKVIIGIAKSPKKEPLFSLEERVTMTKEVLKDLSNVEVFGFEGLLLEFAKQQQANILLRGLRTVTDFDYEFQLAGMNRHLDSTIETIFLMPDERFMSISSTFVREIATLDGNVSDFVPEAVINAFKKKRECR